MLRSCPHHPLPRSHHQEMPATLGSLRAHTRVQELGHDIETLALMGTQFDNALITTRNQGALIADQGGYNSLQTDSAPLRLSARRVNLRIAGAAGLWLAKSEENTSKRLPPALLAVDAQDQIQHRVQYLSPFDRCVGDSLEPMQASHKATRCTGAPQTGNVLSLSAVRNARDKWAKADAGEHLNDLLMDRGRQRHLCLPHIGSERAWRISPITLPSFLAFLCDQNFSFARMVPAQGLIQIGTGPLGSFDMMDRIAVGQSGVSLFSLDMGQVDEARITTSQWSWHIEIYDLNREALAVLSADPMSDQTVWRDFLVSLPRTL